MDNVNTKNYIKQIQECINIFPATVSADVFFSRYALLMTRLDELIRIDPFIKIGIYTISEIKQKNIDEKQSMIHMLINHGQLQLNDKLKTLKTLKAKQSAVEKFCSSFKPYYDQIDDWNKSYISRISTMKVE